MAKNGESNSGFTKETKTSAEGEDSGQEKVPAKEGSVAALGGGVGKSKEEEKSDIDDSLFTDRIIMMDELISLGTTGVHLERKCKALGKVLVWVPRSFADRCGVRKNDCVYSVNGERFSCLEELCKFVDDKERSGTLTIEFMRAVKDPRTGSTRMETFVVNQIYSSLTKEYRTTEAAGRPFQGWKTEKFYLRCNQNGFYVTVEDGKLTLKRTNKCTVTLTWTYQQEFRLNGVIFQVHTGVRVKQEPDSPEIVILEHEKTRRCVSLTRDGISLRPNIVNEELVEQDSRMFRMIDVKGDVDGNGVKFESYRHGPGTKGATGEFLGFEDDDEDEGNWNPVIIPEEKTKIREPVNEKKQNDKDGRETVADTDSEVESETGTDDSLENFSDGDGKNLPDPFLFFLIKKAH